VLAPNLDATGFCQLSLVADMFWFIKTGSLCPRCICGSPAPDLKPAEVIYFLLIVRKIGVEATINRSRKLCGMDIMSGAGSKVDQKCVIEQDLVKSVTFVFSWEQFKLGSGNDHVS
ncbi:hypothetical protein GOODEAATRI_022964, partial [Goodea atripinnis]